MTFCLSVWSQEDMWKKKTLFSFVFVKDHSNNNKQHLEPKMIHHYIELLMPHSRGSYANTTFLNAQKKLEREYLICRLSSTSFTVLKLADVQMWRYFYQDRHRMYKVTLRRVRQSLLSWRRNKYYIFVCGCMRERARRCLPACGCQGGGRVHARDRL